MPGRRLRRTVVVLVLALALWGRAVVVHADEPPRPRIGLCLAGGGARGGAHVGVLKVLEELRVPVDCIAGTSIGSIIGGLYASGWSPAELDSLMTCIDWDVVFCDTPPRDQLEYSRKVEDRLPLFGLEFGWKNGKVRAASGLVAGQRLNFLLRRVNLRTAGVDNFDDLPLPFRATATDLADGSLVVLDHGSLADAMRASMAIPGAFMPHEIDGRTLVDGGIVRNLPYDVVKAMGADVVIVVDVSTPVGELTDDTSFLGVVYRTLDLATGANVAASRALVTARDVLLVPDLTGVGTASFGAMGEAAARGEAVARANLDRLGRLALPPADYEAWRARQRDDRGDPPIRIAAVRFETGGRIDLRRVAPRIRQRPGAPLDLAVLESDLARVYRIGEFEAVDYHLARQGREAPADLLITAREKRWGPNYLKLGLTLSDHFDGNTGYGLLLSHRRTALDSRGAEWRNRLALGNRFALDSEFYQPLSYSGRWFAATGVAVDLDKYRSFGADGGGLDIDRNRGTLKLDLGLALGTWGEARLGVYRGRVSGSTGDATDLRRFGDDEGGVRAMLALDRLDNVEFPRRGWYFNGEGRLSRHGFGADLDYERVTGEVGAAATAGRLTWTGRLEGGTAFGGSLPFHSRSELGGFTRLSGLKPGRLQGDRYALAVTGGYVRVADLGPAPVGNVFVGLLGEAGQTWLADADNALEGRRYTVSAFVGAETILGPAYLGYGRADRGDGSLYFHFGNVF